MGNGTTAAAAYAARCAEAAKVLAAITRAIESHAAQHADTKSWGAAGDMEAARDQLVDVLAQLRGGVEPSVVRASFGF